MSYQGYIENSLLVGRIVEVDLNVVIAISLGCQLLLDSLESLGLDSSVMQVECKKVVGLPWYLVPLDLLDLEWMLKYPLDHLTEECNLKMNMDYLQLVEEVNWWVACNP